MMSGNFRAVVTATAAAGLGVTTFTPRPLFEITVAAIAVVVALGWAPLLPNMGKRLPITSILVATAVAAAVLVRLTHSIAWLAPVFAGALIAVFVAQMFRKERVGLVDQVAGHFAGVVAVGAGAGWLAVNPGPIGYALTLTASVSLASAAIVMALPFSAKVSLLPSVIVSTLAGLGLGFGLEEITVLVATLVGLAGGILVASLHYLFEEYSDSEAALPSLSGALIAVSVSGVPVYILGRVLLHMP